MGSRKYLKVLEVWLTQSFRLNSSQMWRRWYWLLNQCAVIIGLFLIKSFLLSKPFLLILDKFDTVPQLWTIKRVKTQSFMTLNTSLFSQNDWFVQFDNSQLMDFICVIYWIWIETPKSREYPKTEIHGIIV